MASNDIAVRPSNHEITLKGNEIIYYNQSDSSTSKHRIRRVQVQTVRAPTQTTTVWPGDYLEVNIPASLSSEEVVAIEPRRDMKV